MRGPRPVATLCILRRPWRGGEASRSAPPPPSRACRAACCVPPPSLRPRPRRRLCLDHQPASPVPPTASPPPARTYRGGDARLALPCSSLPPTAIKPCLAGTCDMPRGACNALLPRPRPASCLPFSLPCLPARTRTHALACTPGAQPRPRAHQHSCAEPSRAPGHAHIGPRPRVTSHPCHRSNRPSRSLSHTSLTWRRLRLASADAQRR